MLLAYLQKPPRHFVTQSILFFAVSQFNRYNMKYKKQVSAPLVLNNYPLLFATKIVRIDYSGSIDLEHSIIQEMKAYKTNKNLKSY